MWRRDEELHQPTQYNGRCSLLSVLSDSELVRLYNLCPDSDFCINNLLYLLVCSLFMTYEMNRPDSLRFSVDVYSGVHIPHPVPVWNVML